MSSCWMPGVSIVEKVLSPNAPLWRVQVLREPALTGAKREGCCCSSPSSFCGGGSGLLRPSALRSTSGSAVSSSSSTPVQR